MTRIIADTTCGLEPDVARSLDIPLVPQIISFGEESFREGVDIDHATFMSRLSASVAGGGRAAMDLPKTAAPYPGDFIEVLAQLNVGAESVVCIHPSTDVSGTVRSAQTAAESFPAADIRVIDTRTIAGPLASMVLEAGKLAKSGAEADQVERLVRDMIPRARIYFVVDTLEFLQRGGRIGGASALVGTILQIKPILAFKDGRVEPFARERTKKRALARLREIVLSEAQQGIGAHLTVMHSAAPEEAMALATDLKQALGTPDAMVMNLVPAIVTHAGPGTLAVGFFAPPQS